MKIATVEMEGRTRAALVEAGQPVSLLDERFRDAFSVVQTLGESNAAGVLASRGSIDGAAIRVLAPVPRPRRNIFCVGKNYHEHAHEFARSGFDSSAASGAVPEAPIIFSKVPESVIGPDEPILFDPAASNAVDYEGELAVIIGKGGRRISREHAIDHVAAYTIINDVTARDVQGRLKQWLVGKSFDTFCPMGPWLVTADELDLTDTTLQTWVNGELRQRANTRDLIFDVPVIIETISAGVTLYPGDVIATGTPAGVGIGFKPPRYLKHGDHVAIEISGIGRLDNGVRDSSVQILRTVQTEEKHRPLPTGGGV